MDHLSNEQVRDILFRNEDTVVEYMENVFRDYVDGTAEMVPKIYLAMRNGDYRAMPARWGDYSGVKWISVYPDNHKHNLPTIHGTLLLNDTYTGQPIISMDCAELTAYRTAAVSALAAKHLTDAEDVNTIAIVGCGYQAHLHATMYRAVFPNLQQVKVYDKSSAAARSFCDWLQDHYIGSSWSVCECVRATCANSDVVTTLTPSTEPYLGVTDIDSVKHINAVGADAVGKRELESSIWSKCALVVDDWTQASHSGETQYRKDINGYRTLGNVITSGGKELLDQPTVFDSTGLAIEDIAIGRLIYELSQQKQ
tara:strand:+ start:736 stop:1668 length:933 start_codon:yes stop_codon:yes gene_type:complete